MSADPRTIRARLLSSLDDADAIEMRPIGEVRAALEEMGVDPEASIRFAQKLAQRAGADPAARLLRQIEHAEDIDAEIAALENTPIEDVRAALPAGMEASAAAAALHRDRAASSSAAKVATDRPSVPGRRRLSTLGWGGSLIGIAASVLLFIAVRPDRIDQADAPVSPAESAAEVVMEAESDDAVIEEQAAPLEKRLRALDVDGDLSRLQAASPSDRDSSAGERFEAADDGGEARAGAVQELADRLERGFDSDEPPYSVARPDIAFDEVRPPAVVDHRAALSTRASAKATRASAKAVATDMPPLPDDIEAVLMVMEARASSDLQALADAMPEGKLASRLDQARLLAAGRSVIALIAFTREGKTVEAALVEPASRRPSRSLKAESAAGDAAFAESDPVLSAVSGAAFELIELPDRR